MKPVRTPPNETIHLIDAVTAAAGDQTTTAVTSLSPSSTTVGLNTTLTATVVDTANTGIHRAGTVTFSLALGGSTYATGVATVSSGVATYTYNAAYAGTTTLTAAFTPSTPASFSASADTTGKPLTVAAATPVQLADTNDVSVQQNVATTLTIILAYPGTIPPTGAVTLTVNGSALAGLGTRTCVYKVKHSNCSYPYTSQLAPGTYTLTYTQAADANYNSSTGTSSLTVTAMP